MNDQQRAWTPERIAALRLLAGEFFERLEEADPQDVEAQMQVATLGGALAGFVPELLDEIERLRGRR